MPVYNAAFFALLLDSLYAVVLGLDSSGYNYDESDAFTRSTVQSEWTRHLQTWIVLGSSAGFSRASWTYSGHMLPGFRFRTGDDSLSQAIAHAASRDIGEALTSTPLPGCSRAVLTEPYELMVIDEDTSWIELRLPFTLTVPR